MRDSPATPVDPVVPVLMENHDRALRLWHERGEKRRVLLHLDAHHDLWWTPDPASISIANFICPALREDLVREVYWIVPSPTWETRRGRRAVLKHLRAIRAAYPGPRGPILTREDEISTTVLGKPLRVRPLAALPSLAEPVLLDIDVDFLVIPRVTYGEADEHGALPWCWPEELAAKLGASRLEFRFATVAYSVEGGFTPLEWKYLGDELALRLTPPGPSGPPGPPEPSGNPLRHSADLEAMALLRAGAIAAHRGGQSDLVQAAEAYLEAEQKMPASAAPAYRLARLYLDLGRVPEAREAYQRALSIDPTYRTAYGNPGLKHHSERRFAAARREYLRRLDLDPEDASAHYGLARLAVRRQQWRQAERLVRRALAANPQFTDAYRLLGDVLAQPSRPEGNEGNLGDREAVAAVGATGAYERSLRLALAGHPPLGEPIATFADWSDHPVDPAHGKIHARVARLYEMRGALVEATSGYRIAIAGGDDGFATRSRLARVYAKQRQWRKAARASARALAAIPKSLRRAFRRRMRRMKLDLRAG